MPIAITCTCGKKYKLDDKHAGKKLRCRSCDKVLSVPSAAASKARNKSRKARAANDDDELGFMDMDLESEFSGFHQVASPPARVKSEKPVEDDISFNYAATHISGGDRIRFDDSVERKAKVVLGILGIVAGIGLILLGAYLRVRQGIRLRFFIGLGFLCLVGGIGALLGWESDKD